ncbi:hypothetical protein OPW41_21230 [Vibrio europaeus]|uniref:Solute-binding protein family 3/N-terminal domain-containing protein n=1 Tax=Vibrio europaeus TaxID=300876 RepID=A0A178JG58_9VIBR|nr:hypothetical protein [Vibrio europaeus]MDC5707345.1 hypothetical protein [Vibrio europaeus]MDC5712710.1 hypothetical protein [Vibrio europaeus]MDC5717353.1 hypothetical protein [Vibrio europaeus]MDC5721113.1 hypothetical protein [Vibrio europaeus]MDC5726653.1 hypothetical protein [Vibrio europaeus]
MRFLSLFLLIVASQCFAKHSITLTLASQMDGGHHFYHELLFEALTRDGYDVKIMVPSEHIPQKRVIRMVESGQLSLTWLLATPERDSKYLAIDVPLTNGLIGKRVMLIPPQLQTRLNHINTLQDLKDSNLVAGLGVNWFDVDVWKANELKVYEEDGEWRTLYNKLTPDGDVNYFPRGMNEIGAEAAQNEHLAIEQRLLLVYDRDFKFYLSPSMVKYQPAIQHALDKAKASGLIDQLVRKHWGESFQQIKPDQRVVIKLELPNQTSQKR